MQYFVFSPELATRQKEAERRKAAESDSHEFPNRQRNMILGGIFALTAMVSYALFTGIVRTEMFYEEEDDVEIEMD